MKKLLSLLCLFTSCAHADCLTDIRKNQDSWSMRTPTLYGEITGVVYWATAGFCKKEELKFTYINCEAIKPMDFFSEVCYLESDVGYFFVTRDMFHSSYVTFNRWE